MFLFSVIEFEQKLFPRNQFKPGSLINTRIITGQKEKYGYAYKWELLELIDKNIPIGKKGLLDFNIRKTILRN